MITENLGKIAITPKGQWVAVAYERIDMVTDAGSSYISLKDNNVSALNTADWMLVAEKGDTGLQGEKGIQGEKGDTGNGIQSITLLSTVGLVKTYRVTFTDNTTYDYTVTDGASTPIVQTTGASTTDVMSQKAVTDELVQLAGLEAEITELEKQFNDQSENVQL